MKEELMKIMKMVEEGKITAEEAIKLIEALGEKKDVEKKKGKVLKILVKEGDEKKVSVAVPLKLISLIKKFVPKDITAGERKINLEEILDSISGDFIGEIVNIEDEDSEAVVKIWIE